MIPQAFIEEVRARTDIVELISSYIPLKRAGRNFKALCPFHSEKTSSFVVSPQKQIFHCFGCSQGGGITQFLMLYERVSFVEALEMLANRLGLEVPYQKAEKNKAKTILYDAVYEASLFFHKNLMQKPDQNPFDYLDKRGINQEAIIQFRLGFAFGKNTLLDFLRKKGFAL
ncbi:MAG: DNA primase, partial [Candidatus Omnitrophica bacterium]|nr:DNA primase [Candidatus Omnitrophota bacterium]